MKKLFERIKKRLNKKQETLNDIYIAVLSNIGHIKSLADKVGEIETQIKKAIPDITVTDSLLEVKEQLKGINNYVYNDLKAIIKKSQKQVAGFGFGGYNKENK